MRNNQALTQNAEEHGCPAGNFVRNNQALTQNAEGHTLFFAEQPTKYFAEEPGSSANCGRTRLFRKMRKNQALPIAEEPGSSVNNGRFVPQEKLCGTTWLFRMRVGGGPAKTQ